MDATTHEAVRRLAFANLSKDEVLLVYGSRAYAIEGAESDVDLVAICQVCTSERRHAFAKSVAEMHERLSLPLDVDVPLHQKTMATFQDVARACAGDGFPREGTRLTVEQVVKTPDFLGSERLRLRLLLNALTGKVIAVYGDPATAAGLQGDARDAWLSLLPRITGKSEYSIPDIVDALIGDEARSGEWHLGFRDHPAVRGFLVDVFSSRLDRESEVGDGIYVLPPRRQPPRRLKA